MFGMFGKKKTGGSSKDLSKADASKSSGKTTVVVEPTPVAAANDGPNIELPSGMPKVVLEDFDLLKVLGKGGFGKVMLVRKKKTTDIYAMKVLKKEAVIRRNQVAHTKTETHILKQIRHPFLTRMYFGAPGSLDTSQHPACVALCSVPWVACAQPFSRKASCTWYSTTCLVASSSIV
jgi:serine/threonine protein kinase